jgi:hypothetical protein
MFGVSTPVKEPAKTRNWKKIDERVLKEAHANHLGI